MAQMVKYLPAVQETQVQSLSWEDSPGEGNGYALWDSGESHGHKSLASCSPWSCKEFGTTSD